MGVIESPKPPGTRDRYIAAEERLRKFSEDLDIPMDELDLLLWSEKTGEILK
jgi:thermostable 8-oxoguanine DNA glycosylase